MKFVQTIFYLISLFATLGCGALLATWIGKERGHSLVTHLLNVVLYLLLFFMGVNTGRLENITTQLASMGLYSLLSTFAVILGTLLLGRLASCVISFPASPNGGTKSIGISWERLKTPLLLIATLVMGLLLALFTSWFNWFNSNLISLLLYCLLFFSGMQMVQHQISFFGLFRSPMLIIMPLFTIGGTYLGALLIALCSDLPVNHAMAMVSGFGWYSLSGVMISALGDPVLGTISFLINLFRETAALILIPIFSALGWKVHYGMALAGATSMDVTLPVLKRGYTEAIVPLAIVHGSLLTLIAPLLIRLWY